MRLLLLFCINIICVNAITNQAQFQTIYEWKYFDYKWRNASQKATAIASGDYNYTKCVILDADTAKGNIRCNYLLHTPLLLQKIYMDYTI
jgi:hypothetical protein